MTLINTAEDLAALFHRTYERVGREYGCGQGLRWEQTEERYRQTLVDTMADMELALRPGRSAVQVQAGQTVLLCVPAGHGEKDLATLRNSVAAMLPDNTVVVVSGVTSVLAAPGPQDTP